MPESLFSAIAALNFDSPNFEDWRGIGAKILVTLRAEVAPDPQTRKDQITLEAKVYFADSGQTMLAKRYSGPADNPRVFAHQASTTS